MRLAAVLVAMMLAACGARGAGEPAWPKAAETETDGGESLAPRESIKVAAAEDTTTEKTDDVVEPAAAATPVAEDSATPTPTSTQTIISPEDSIIIEEIVIEISSDDE